MDRAQLLNCHGVAFYENLSRKLGSLFSKYWKKKKP
jgi:hypothetical protein